MGMFFSHARGSVKRVTGPWQKQSSLRVVVQGMNFRNQAIVTQAGVDQNGNFQILHPAEDQIFVYVFGRRISELYVAGVAFATPCDGQPNIPGTDVVLDFWEANRIDVREEPVIVSLGNRSFRSLLTGCKVDIADPETQLAQFMFRMHCFPVKK